VIEPGASVPGFIVFADCTSDAETVRNSKIRKGSLVRVKGKFQTFGASAVNLSDCQIVEKYSNSRVYARVADCQPPDKFGQVRTKKRKWKTCQNLSKLVISGAKNEK
jgi:hypothetical protein